MSDARTNTETVDREQDSPPSHEGETDGEENASPTLTTRMHAHENDKPSVEQLEQRITILESRLDALDEALTRVENTQERLKSVVSRRREGEK